MKIRHKQHSTNTHKPGTCQALCWGTSVCDRGTLDCLPVPTAQDEGKHPFVILQ